MPKAPVWTLSETILHEQYSWERETAVLSTVLQISVLVDSFYPIGHTMYNKDLWARFFFYGSDLPFSDRM